VVSDVLKIEVFPLLQI